MPIISERTNRYTIETEDHIDFRQMITLATHEN